MTTPYSYTCKRCGVPHTSEQVWAICPDCVKIGGRRLTDEQYVEWLKLARSRIDGGLPLVFWDDETEGAKETYCSWGMCNSDLNAWPWQDTWKHPRCTKPTGPVGKKQVDHIRRLPHQWCPFDRGAENNEGQADMGCFYRCSIFQSGGAAHLSLRNCGVLSCINTLDDFNDYLGGLWNKLPWAKRLTEASVRLLELWETGA